MAVSESFRTFVLDQLGRTAPRIRFKSMFGGVGVYAGEYFFALIDDDVLYLKVDDVNRGDFAERGMKPFAPFGEGGEVMQYYRLPEGVLDDVDELKPWVDGSIAVAERKRKKKPKAAAKKPGARPKKP